MKLADFEKYVCQLSIKLHIGNSIMEGYYIIGNMKAAELLELQKQLSLQ